MGGRRVALLSRNHRSFVISLLATGRLGCDVLPLGTDSPATVLTKLLAQQRIELVVHDTEFAPLLACALGKQQCTDIQDLLKQRVAGELPRLRRAGNLLVLTSGSTGLAKGVRRKPALTQILPPMAGLLEALPLHLHRPIVLAIPLYHGYGLTSLALSLALAAPLHLARRPDIAPLLASVPSGPLPMLVSVPTLLQRWLRTAQVAGQQRLAAIISGSAPLDAALCTALLDAFGPVLFNFYGSTEAGIVAMALPADLMAAPGCVGRPLPATLLRLQDADGFPSAPGSTGHIQVRGPFVLRPHAMGWLNTGDLGRLDALGRLFLCGRADEMIISGGENVYPQETESALAAHPALADVAVLVVADAEFGQRIAAFAVPVVPIAVNAAELQGWLREHLPRYKLPREIHLIQQIPRNALGKVDRAQLAAELQRIA